MFFKYQKSLVVRFVLVLALLGGMFGAVPVRSVSAATLIVTNTSDGAAGSLRHAIAIATSGDTIRFDPSLAGQTITLASDLIIINKDLTIDGSGLSPQVTISGGNVAHVEVLPFGVVTISDLVISNGYNAGSGGAISSAGNTVLTLINSTLKNNHADSRGGAISSTGNTALTLINSTLKNNHADSSGGAMFSAGSSLSISNTTFYQNDASGDGGAIYSSGPYTTIVNSTITQNQAGLDGGAIFINANSAGDILVNSTIAQNQAGLDGGAIFIQGNGVGNIFNSTFAGNIATNGSEMFLGGGTVELWAHNTILACLPESSTCHVQRGLTELMLFNSILEKGTLADFGLSKLADNGGPTQTMALLPGSSLIDAGDDTVCESTPVNNLDQRGIARPQGAHCDIGAFEGVRFTISGNAGVSGAMFSYVDGTTRTSTADNAGNYSFAVPTGWSGIVTPSRARYIFNPTSKDYSNVTADQANQDYSVTATDITFSVSGNVGIAGATLGYDDGTPKTVSADVNGDYTITVPYGWSGAVTPSMIGYSFSPASRNYTNILAHQPDENYIATSVPLTFTVNNVMDAIDGNQGDGLCETLPGNGICTLRAAIKKTNANPGADKNVITEEN